ncbi:hypothetical protein IFM89_014467 [Coptis chinensis]|uniref:RING-type domain-containing protein n=1 Tax=Coptis chinensis TaxID=261450 RepID=A0A835I3F5_9MAGN|nr:hypothetical protein IFM89_014467 [Coptis chinensis]
MPQRHSKNNNDLAYFTYDEKKKLGYGTQKERLGRDSIKPFDACCLCLKPLIDPLCCQKGHVFCKECILECLLSQKKDIQRSAGASMVPGRFPEFGMQIWDAGESRCSCWGFQRDRDAYLIRTLPEFEEYHFGRVVVEDDGELRQEAPKRLAAHALQQKQENDEEEEKLMLQKAKELEAFDQQNHGAVPQYNDRSYTRDKNGFHGANSVKVTSYEAEALRNMKAFWLPSATPEAPVKVQAPSTSTICPEGKEKLKLKTLFPIYLTEENKEQKKSNSINTNFICPSCKVTLTNTLTLVALSTCGHVFCKKCADRFMAVDKVCLVCNKGCKERSLVCLERGGTGFAAHDDHLEATDFKHLGSGSGLGLVRPAVKT